MRLFTLLRVPGALTTEIELHLRVFREHYRSKGIFWALRGFAKRVYYLVGWIALLPLSVAFHLLGYRCLTVLSEHIGHLAADMDGFVRDLKLGRIKPHIWVLLAPPGKTANEHLLTYWAPYATVVQSAAICHVLAMASRWLLVRHDVTRYLASKYGTQELFRVHAEWGSRSPVLRLRDEDVTWGRMQFAKLGLPDEAWFACVHVREGGFLPHNEPIQRHRNAEVHTVIPAMEEITRRGGWCIRMGDPSMTPLPALSRVIDYAHHPLKSPRLDVILCARARFFLGCTSGLSLVSTIFGIPCALANMIPVSAALAVGPNDLSVPKLLWFEKEKRHLRFDEIMGSEIGSYYFTYLYDRAGIRVLDNTEDEIRGLVVEKLGRLDGKFVEAEEDRELQRRYMALFKPGHYSYGAASRVGSAFLRKYRHLLG